MHLTKILYLVAVCLFCTNAKVVKRQKKITKVLSKTAPGSPISVIPKALLETTNGCLGSCGCQNIYLDELPYGCIEGYGLTPDILSFNHLSAIELPKTLQGNAGIPLSAINLPALYQCDVPSYQCRNTFPFADLPGFLNHVDVASPKIKIPTEIIQSLLETPILCGCRLPLEMCGQKCGCQLSVLDIPCNCQLPLGSCGCQLSLLDVPFGCQLPALNLPCGCQLPGLDCGCQMQVFNGPCSCHVPVGACGCQLPVPNLPVAYQLSLDVPCGCQLPGCGCQLPVGGCGKYLRQVTLQPPFL